MDESACQLEKGRKITGKTSYTSYCLNQIEQKSPAEFGKLKIPRDFLSHNTTNLYCNFNPVKKFDAKPIPYPISRASLCFAS